MPSSVLIVDPSADNREVLRTALARRGLAVLEADAAERGLELAREYHPNVIVVDIDNDPENEAAQEQIAAEAEHDGSRLIILGKVHCSPAFTGGHVVSKPYHFAPLVHTIEQLAAKAA